MRSKERIGLLSSDEKYHRQLEQEPVTPFAAPESARAEITAYNPNLLEFELYSDTTSLFVISQTFYPPGWKIFLDKNPVKNIYKTNHAVQSVIIPAGEHQLRIEFLPDSYFQEVRLSYISLGILYLAVLIPVIAGWLRKRRTG